MMTELLPLVLLTLALIAVAYVAAPKDRSKYRPRLEDVKPKRSGLTEDAL